MWGKRLVVLLGIVAMPGGGYLVARELPFFRISEERSAEFLEKGMYHYNAHNFVSAREYFYRSLDIKSDLSVARRFLGDSYYFTGDYESALEQWESLLSSSGASLFIQDRINLIQHRFTKISDPGDYRFYGWLKPDRKKYIPVDVQTDDGENIYVLSLDPAAIYVFRPAFQTIRNDGRSPEFEQTATIGTMGSSLWDRLVGPVAFHLYKSRFYIADFKADRIVILEKDGRPVRRFGATGSADGEFHGPSGIVVIDDTIYVADQRNHRIQKFDLDGNFVGAFRPDTMKIPAGLSAQNHQLAVADMSGAVLILDQDGLVIETIRDRSNLSRPASVDWQGDHLFIADEKTGPKIYNLTSKQFEPLPEIRDEDDHSLELERSTSFRSDRQDRLYIANGSGRILHLTREASLRSGYDLTFYPVESEQYPDVALALRVADRTRTDDTIVDGLINENFMIFENGSRVYPLRVDGMDRFQNRMNLVIVKENSKGFEELGLNDFLDSGMRDILAGIRVSDRIRLSLADHRTTQVYDGLERRNLISKMYAEPAVDSPAIGRGIYDGITSLLDRKGPAGILLVASGRYYADAFEKYDPAVLIQYAQAHSLPVYVVSFEAGLADEADIGNGSRQMADIYRQICNETGGRYVRFFDEQERKLLYKQMIAKKDPRYLITYRSPAGSGLHGRFMQVSVQIHHRKTTGATDGGYFVP